jgi:hypothetical protein
MSGEIKNWLSIFQLGKFSKIVIYLKTNLTSKADVSSDRKNKQ